LREGVRQASTAAVRPGRQTEIVAPDSAKFVAGRKAFDTPIQVPTQVRESKRRPLASRAKSDASRGDAAEIAKSRGSAIASKPAAPVSPSAPIRTQVESIPVIAAAPSSSAAAFATNNTEYRRRGGTVQPAQLLTNINPVYPVSARESGIAGAVELRFKISTTGDVHDIVVVRGPLVLAEAAVDAVRERRYKPARVDGVPTETDASGIFDFKLQ
jgi:TonB family protein